MQIEPNWGLIQQSPAKLKQRKPLDFLRRIGPFQGLTPTPHGLFYFSRPSRLKEATGRMGAPGSHGFVCRFVGLHFEFLWPSSELKGWRLFMFADAWASLSDSAAAEPMSAKREPRGPWTMSPRTGDKDRPIDPMSGRKFAIKRARTGFGPNRQADGRQPFMPRVSHDPCPLMLPFRFAHAMRMRPLSVGRLESAFHPAIRPVKRMLRKFFAYSVDQVRGLAPTLVASVIWVTPDRALHPGDR
jgi:hypothetical protein